MGLDGWCCEKGDEHKTKNDDPVNYTKLATKGLLGGYKPRNARVYVDNEEYNFKNVYLVSTMNGRLYGGGIPIAPDQDRLNPEKNLTVVVAHANTRIGIISTFLKVLKGKHKNSSNISMFVGKEVKVIYDKSCAVQIDGETIKDVSEYTVRIDK
jgi:diacylglycerol kinase family enzyme